MISFKKYFTETTVVGNPRVGSGIGSPPEPPFNDEGDNDDDEQWEWDNVIARYSQVIQNWLDSDSFAKKCKGAVLERIFRVQPQVEVNIWSEKENHIEPTGDVDLEIKWSYSEGNLPNMFLSTIRNANKCNLWKSMGIQPEQWYATLDKGYLSEVIWHYFAMSLAGTSIPILLHPQGDASHRLGLNSQWEKDKITLTKYAEFVFKSNEVEYEQKVKDEVHNHWIMSRQPEPKDIRIQHLGNKSDGHYWKDVFETTIRSQYYYQIHI